MTRRKGPPADEQPRSAAPTPRIQLCLAALLLIVLVLFTFSGAFSAGFVRWDDFTLVVNNSWLNPASWASFKHFWTRPHEGLYTPLAYSLWTMVAMVTPPQQSTDSAAAGFHAVNILLHAAAVVACLLLLYELTGRAAAAGVGALIFGLHPLQVEPVAWVSGMNNVLAGALSMGGLWCYVRHAKLSGARARYRWYAAAAGLVLLALLSKPTAMGVPLIAAALDLLLLRRPARLVAVSIAPLMLMALLMAVVTRSVQPAGDISAPTIPFRIVVALDAIAFYLGKLSWPVGLCIDYGRTPAWLADNTARYVTWIAPAGLLLVSMLFRNRFAYLLAGILIFIAALLPVLGLTPFDFQQYSTVADRYAYLALLGPALVAGGALAPARRGLALAIGVALGLPLVVFSFVQTAHWMNTDALLAHALSLNPHSLMANRNIAAAMLDAGQLEQAQLFAQRAVEFHPRSPDARLNAAAVAMAGNDPAAAIGHYEAALTLRPGHVATHYGLAGALAQVGQLDRALDHAISAVALDPRDGQAQINLGTILYQRGDVENAITALRRAHRLAPNDVRAMTNLAVMLLSQNQPDEAIALVKRAVQINPRFAPANALLRELQHSQ